MYALRERPRSVVHRFAKEAVARACEAARRVGYLPGSPQMLALERAEAYLALVKETEAS